MTRVFIIAGEPSGDRLGAALIAGLRQLDPKLEVTGVGGPAMQAEGITSLFPMAELSVMGIAEVLPKLRGLLARVRECRDAILTQRPDVLITIDSPDFCLRVSRQVKALRPEQRVAHYVAPSVWAWRPERAAKMARSVDQVLCLLPFEPPYMEAAGMRADFVGHPVTTEPVATADEAAGFRAAHGLGADQPLLLALPGSRKGEVSRLTPVFGAALGRLQACHPDLAVVVPSTENVAELAAQMTSDWSLRPILLDPRGQDQAAFADRKRAAFRAADLSLAASGTVSLELAASATPMVIAYDMNWVSRRMISRMLKIDTVTLVNLVSETRVVPEFLGEKCDPGPIAEALHALLSDPDVRKSQDDAMALTMDRLGRGGAAPGIRAARAVLDGLESSGPRQ